jgi:hypothetical protein
MSARKAKLFIVKTGPEFNTALETRYSKIESGGQKIISLTGVCPQAEPSNQ